MTHRIRKPDMKPCKTPMTLQVPAERIDNFDEVAFGYTEEQAMEEAERCMNCPYRYCAEDCPIHVPIPEFIAEIREGKFKEAYHLIASANPIPEISSRICPQECQCESNCTRGIKGEPVAIGRLERFVADWYRGAGREDQASILAESTNAKRVAVVGSGPAGLGCAGTLAKAGCDVTILEGSERLGGVMAWGIPSFVFHSALLKDQLRILQNLGVKMRVNAVLGRDYTLESLMNEGYAAVFIGVGASVSACLNIEGAKLPGVLQAADYLTASKYGETPTGERVAVIGGGNTAIDAARVAVRSGAKKVSIFYRRSAKELPARQEDVLLAQEEGVEFHYLRSPREFRTGKNHKLSGILCDKMTFLSSDYPGGRRNVVPSGETESYEVDLAILAIGFGNNPVTGLNTDEEKRILVDKRYQTNLPHVYAGGDAVNGASTVMKAFASGKMAAQSILAD